MDEEAEVRMLEKKNLLLFYGDYGLFCPVMWLQTKLF